MSVKIRLSTDVLMRGRHLLAGRVVGQGIQLVVEDVADAFVGADATGQRPPTCRLKPLVTVPFAQSENAQTGTIRLLWMVATVQNSGHQLRGVRPNCVGPCQEALGRPRRILLMRHWHMLTEGCVTDFAT